MSRGAPAAIQVVDRFHLLQSLTQVLEQALSSQGAMLKAVDTAQRLAEAPFGAAVVQANQVPTQVDAQQRTQVRRAQRLKAYQKVRHLYQQGWSLKATVHQAKLSTLTVQRDLLISSFPERQGRSDQGRSLLNSYKAYLLQQYNQGNRQVKGLFGELQAQGYIGSYQTVARYVHQLAQAQGITLRPYPTHRTLPPVAASSRPAHTARRQRF